MPTTLTNGIQLPDKGSVDWYSSMQSNYNLIDTHLGDTDVHVTAEDKANWNSKQGSLSQDQLDAIAQVATNTDDIATLQSSKADASHTHSSSDITDIDDYATKDYVDNSISGLVDNAPDALNTLNELSAALNDDSNFASTVTTALAAKADSADLATVATSGSYNDLDDLPTIPTNTSDLTNDSDFVVSSNLATVATSGDYDDLSNKPSIPTKTSDLTNDSNFVDSSSLAAVATSGDYDDLDNKPSIPTNTSDLNNDSGFVTLNDFDIPSKTSDLTNDSGFITSSDVPTSTSDLTNDSNFVDTSNSAVSSGITSAKVTDYDTHISDTDIHVTTADKATWNTVTSKANDSDVVHKSGDETVGGKKTFTNDVTVNNSNATVQADVPNLIFQNPLMERASTTLDGEQTILFTDKNDNNIASIQAKTYTSGTADIILTSYSETSDQSVRTTGIVIRRTPTTSKFHGFSDNITSLGDTNRRWSRVYAMNYYYGNDNVEFSTKFVTTDTNQTIHGAKTFNNHTYIYDPDATATTPNLYLRSSKIEISSQGNTSGGQDLTYLDKNKVVYANVKGAIQSNGSSVKIRAIAKDSSDNLVINELQMLAYTNGNKAIFPTYSNEIDLGVSNYKWKSFNGLEPSSLSLPSGNVSDVIDISSYITDLSGNINNYTAPANGWITITMSNCTGIHAYITDLWGDSRVRASAGAIKFLMPVLKNQTATFLVFGGSIDNARFIPCQGNV